MGDHAKGPTKAQLAELKRLGRAMQNTFGKARCRVQNNLQRMGLARVGGDWCVITDAGRALLTRLGDPGDGRR